MSLTKMEMMREIESLKTELSQSRKSLDACLQVLVEMNTAKDLAAELRKLIIEKETGTQ